MARLSIPAAERKALSDRYKGSTKPVETRATMAAMQLCRHGGGREHPHYETIRRAQFDIISKQEEVAALLFPERSARKKTGGVK